MNDPDGDIPPELGWQLAGPSGAAGSSTERLWLPASAQPARPVPAGALELAAGSPTRGADSAYLPLRAGRRPGPADPWQRQDVAGRLTRRRLLAMVVAAVVLIAVAAIYATRGKAPSVVTAAAGPTLVDAHVGGSGTLAAQVDVPVTSGLTGISGDLLVTQVNVLPGQTVRPGQSLVDIDPAPLEEQLAALETELSTSQANVTAARSELTSDRAANGSTGVSSAEQALQLADSDLSADQSQLAADQATLAADRATLAAAQASPSSQSSVPGDEAAVSAAQQSVGGDQSRLHTDQQTVITAERTLAEAQSNASQSATDQQADLATDQSRLQSAEEQQTLDENLVSIAEGNNPSINAPASAVVERVDVRAGSVVSTTATLVELVDPTEAQVSATIPVQELPLVRVGQAARLTFAALPGQSLDGEVAAVSPEASGSGLDGTVLVYAADPGATVPVGAQAFVDIDDPVRAAVAVPSTCVFNQSLDPSVWVVGRDDRVTDIPVRVGATGASHTQVTSGLSSGQVCVAAGGQLLTAGEQVRISGR